MPAHKNTHVPLAPMPSLDPVWLHTSSYTTPGQGWVGTHLEVPVDNPHLVTVEHGLQDLLDAVTVADSSQVSARTGNSGCVALQCGPEPGDPGAWGARAGRRKAGRRSHDFFAPLAPKASGPGSAVLMGPRLPRPTQPCLSLRQHPREGDMGGVWARVRGS